jgi:hypothetical protein
VLPYHYQSDRIIIAIPYYLSRDLCVMVKKNQEKETDDMTELISQAEAARVRGVTRAAIQDLVRRGRIRSVNVGGGRLSTAPKSSTMSRASREGHAKTIKRKGEEDKGNNEHDSQPYTF